MLQSWVAELDATEVPGIILSSQGPLVNRMDLCLCDVNTLGNGG